MMGPGNSGTIYSTYDQSWGPVWQPLFWAIGFWMWIYLKKYNQKIISSIAEAACFEFFFPQKLQLSELPSSLPEIKPIRKNSL